MAARLEGSVPVKTPHRVTLTVVVWALLLSPNQLLAQFSQQGLKLVGSGAVGNAFQGQSVALSADGNTAIAGGVVDANSGAAWVWTRSGGIWTQQGTKLAGSGAVGNANQGQSVALSADGNTAIVGGAFEGTWSPRSRHFARHLADVAAAEVVVQHWMRRDHQTAQRFWMRLREW
jgi:hypothetical protein